MKLDDLNFEIPLEPVDEENWDLEKWRKENPMDYFKALAIMSKAENSIVISEIFKTIYTVTRLHIPDVLYKYYSISNDEPLNKIKFQTLSNGKMSVLKRLIKDFDLGEKLGEEK